MPNDIISISCITNECIMTRRKLTINLISRREPQYVLFDIYYIIVVATITCHTILISIIFTLTLTFTWKAVDFKRSCKTDLAHNTRGLAYKTMLKNHQFYPRSILCAKVINIYILRCCGVQHRKFLSFIYICVYIYL